MRMGILGVHTAAHAYKNKLYGPASSAAQFVHRVIKPNRRLPPRAAAEQAGKIAYFDTISLSEYALPEEYARARDRESPGRRRAPRPVTTD